MKTSGHGLLRISPYHSLANTTEATWNDLSVFVIQHQFDSMSNLYRSSERSLLQWSDSFGWALAFPRIFLRASLLFAVVF
ncbi:hypothetical protein TNCV_4073231 [Trichonephila clavipes]|uniref:Uncharacterized protein n=1 Tax=Trichonephila clavipes TaxID=2585209 RepID=A0A8X6W8B7_TRICX|nr:hypothetical protein TNCV_4073231 [Trichonephila clavipes]